jgi:hypothetical protein
MQIRGGEVRAQIRAMSPYGAVFHKTVFQNDLLTGNDVGAGEERRAGRTHDAIRNRRTARTVMRRRWREWNVVSETTAFAVAA